MAGGVDDAAFPEPDVSADWIPTKPWNCSGCAQLPGSAHSVGGGSSFDGGARHASITYLIAVAREKRVSAHAGDGLNRWPAVHRPDAANLYRLVLEKGFPGARCNTVSEEGVPLREIAEAIGRGLKVPVLAKSPEEAREHFGWPGAFVGLDIPASSALMEEPLG
jgi:nucleoside-diphosphate-sugar epimerase